MTIVYQMLIGLLFLVSFPLLLAVVVVTGKHRQGLAERLGFCGPMGRKGAGGIRIWLHAASVGEVQAAKAIINAIRRRLPLARCILTTMTIQGKRVAQEQLPPDVICILAPLDLPLIVDRVLACVEPDIYVCIETELWPLLLHKAAARGVKLVLLNGRMSERSCRSYCRFRRLFAGVLQKFSRIAVISEADRGRYLAVGANEATLSVEGNCKYDLTLPEAGSAQMPQERCRSLLGLKEGLEVLITGSTHTGEEELLIPVFLHLQAEKELLWVLAPRHLERLPAIITLLQAYNLRFDRFSDLRRGEPRRHQVVLLDSLGELAELYAVATYVFCGGSLVARGGHNVMEAAIWDKAVCYGPSVGDFRDAVELLESVQAGFQVEGAQELEETIRRFRNNPEDYAAACQRAGDMARRQQGAAERQAAIVLQCLNGNISATP